MRFAIAVAVALGLILTPTLGSGRSFAADDRIAVRSGVVYAEHDGIKLVGDLYLPTRPGRVPILVAIHGGGWQAGDRGFYQHWGPLLARNGYGLFSIDYRLGKRGAYPAAVYDVRAAIQFVRARADEFNIDANRVGLVGDSAGGYFAALLALAGDRFTSRYRDDAYAATPIDVKVVIGFYGIYDLLAQWRHDVRAQSKREDLAESNNDRIVRPPDNITQAFLGAAPEPGGTRYIEASPISYVAPARKGGPELPRFLLITGDRDPLVDARSQSDAFAASLTQAGFVAERVGIAGAGHFWVSDPFGGRRSFPAMAAPQLLRFLEKFL
ncbi:MAG TPA: alpha/beta hydrolase [Xanthobacteraceae bacterium]|jgi:acetyl esterase/lipase